MPSKGASPAWLVDVGKLKTEMVDLPQDERLKVIKELSQPVTPNCCASVAPLSWFDDMLIAVEFIFWMVCLIAPGMASVVGIVAVWYRCPVILICCGAVLFCCIENQSKDRWPKGPPLAHTDRFIRYLSWRLIFEDPDCYSKHPAIFPVVPHGIFPATLFALLLLLPRTPIHRIIGAQASSTFYFPYWRQFSRWCGSCHATQHDITKQLKRGYSVTTFMDGIHGMFMGSSGNAERVFVAQKKGLIKLALRTGTPLVPCYCFGQSKLVNTGQDPFGFMMWLSRKLKVSLVLPVGRWCLPIPFRTPCTMVLGCPISVERHPGGSEPDPARVNELHAEFLKETSALFERYKDVCGYNGKMLQIE